MDKELIQKLTQEQPLGAEEALRLDAALEGPEGRSIALAVSNLAEDAPSLAWRSGLNEALSKVSRRRRAVVVLRFGFGATAVAAACFLVATFFQPMQPTAPVGNQSVADNKPEESLEDAILAGHQDAMNQASLGVTVSFGESGS